MRKFSHARFSMPSSSLTAFAQDMTDTGQLDVSVVSAATAAPVADAQVSIAYTGDPSGAIEQLTTDNNGQTEAVSLPAPPVEYSLNPDRPQPYSEYTLTITAPGFDPFQVSGVRYCR